METTVAFRDIPEAWEGDIEGIGIASVCYAKVRALMDPRRR